MSAKIIALFVLFLSLEVCYAKIFQKCDVVKALRKAKVPEKQIPTWVCIANAESRFDTKAVNRQTWDYGIFQISSLYWCEKGNKPGKACNLSCNSLLNDDITDDIACIRLIYAETEKIGQRPGFKAWTTYLPNCSKDNSEWVAGC